MAEEPELRLGRGAGTQGTQEELLWPRHRCGAAPRGQVCGLCTGHRRAAREAGRQVA